MYLVSWIEDEGKVEASLGGRVTIEEMHVFAEELQNVVASFEDRPYVLTIDHSKAKPFDIPTQILLADLKDECLAGNAQQIVTIVESEEAKANLTNERLMPVMEGREQILLAAVATEWVGAEMDEGSLEIRRAA